VYFQQTNRHLKIMMILPLQIQKNKSTMKMYGMNYFSCVSTGILSIPELVINRIVSTRLLLKVQRQKDFDKKTFLIKVMVCIFINGAIPLKEFTIICLSIISFNIIIIVAVTTQKEGVASNFIKLLFLIYSPLV